MLSCACACVCAAPGAPPESTPSIMSWPDERGPDGDSSAGTLGARNDAAGIWLWPNPVLKAVWGRSVEQGQGLAVLRRQQLSCHSPSCGAPAGEELSHDRYDPADQAGLRKQTFSVARHKPLSSLQHEFQGFESRDAQGSKGASRGSAQADAGGGNMEAQWNSVMNHIGRQDAASGMFIPGAAYLFVSVRE